MADDYDGETELIYGRPRNRKLLFGDRVEVLCLDEGFVGAWLQGVVIDCGKCFRSVEFDELLSDNEDSKLVRSFPVSYAIDGETIAGELKHRGQIRPLPPHQVLELSQVSYGMCVDALVDGAWWEGVVYDKNDDSPSRLVFFPDQGDQKMIAINKMRPTHEWNEISGSWKIRGKWLLLSVLQQFEKNDALPVSIREIWYDLRTTVAFTEEIGEWFFGMKPKWFQLVSNLLEELLCVAHGLPLVDPVSSIRYVGHCIEDSSYFGGLPVVSINTKNFNSSKLFLPCDSLTPLDDCDASFSEATGNDVEQAMSVEVCREEAERHSSENDIYSLCIDQHAAKSHPLAMELELGMIPCTSVNAEYGDSLANSCHPFKEIERGENNKAQNGSICCGDDPNAIIVDEQEGDNQNGRSWQAVDLEPENCPDAVSSYLQYLRYGRCQPTRSEKIVKNIYDARLKLKKHLLFHGWRVESRRDNAKNVRLVSPEGKAYFRYSMDFLNLVEGEHEKHPGYGAQFSPLKEKQHLARFSKEHMGHKHKINSDISRTMVEDACCNGRSSNSGNFNFCSNDNLDEIRKNKSSNSIPRKQCGASSRRKSNLLEPRYSIESIVDYVSYFEAIKRKEKRKDPNLNADLLRLNALSHILFMGWLFETRIIDERKISHYCSPSGEYHRSLYSACKACLHDVAYSDGNATIEGGETRSLEPEKCLTVIGQLNKKEASDSPLFYSSTISTCRRLNNPFSCTSKCRNSKKRKRNCSFHGQDSKTGGKNLPHIEASSKTALARFGLAFRRHPKLKSNIFHSESDTICSICHVGGELLLCESCPSTYHAGCVGLEGVPDGKWFCPPCCCTLCGLSEFSSDTDEFTEDTIMHCDQCVRQYHVGCLRKQALGQLRSYSVGRWFCSKQCSKMFKNIHRKVGKTKSTSVSGLKGDVVRWSKESNVVNGMFSNDLINKCHSKLLRTLDVLHECFVPVIEPRDQRDLFADLLFNKESELNRLNFWGFSAMILLKGDELISVVAFRVFDERVAEVPLIGTRIKYRKQGMCRLLMNELEKFLSDLGVQKLVLSSVPELLGMWKTSFGFNEMSGSQRLELSEFTFVSFQDAVMCQKLLGVPKDYPEKTVTKPRT